MPWIPLTPETCPPEEFHGRLLVTNNITAVNRYGYSSHVWLTNLIHYSQPERFLVDRVTKLELQYHCFTEPGDVWVGFLTHWRPAIQEDWMRFAVKEMLSHASSCPARMNMFRLDLRDLERPACTCGSSSKHERGEG